MGAELHLARRYLLGLRRRSHVATVSLISFISLALGVLALVVTLSMLEGFQATIRAGLVERVTHARVEAVRARVLERPDELASVLQRALPGVEIVQVVRGTCLVVAKTDAVPASVIGRSDARMATLDRVLAARTGAGPGEEVTLVSPRRRLTPMGPLPVRVPVEVEGVAMGEPAEETGAIRMPLEAGQRLLWGSPVVDGIELRDRADPWRLGDRVERILEGAGFEVRVPGLEELNRSLLLALTLERVMIFVAVGLMLVVAALNLLCNVAMVAAEKRRDLAVLAGLGMTPAGLRRLFLLLGMGIGVIGAATGAILGVAVALLLDRSEALPLPRGLFVPASVPFAVDPATVALVLAAALGLATLSSWLPARAVARREPAEGLHYE